MSSNFELFSGYYSRRMKVEVMA